MTVLVKDFLAADPGLPGTPGTPPTTLPGSPATPPKPAYCVDIYHPAGNNGLTIIYDPIGNPATGRPPGYVILPGGGVTPPYTEHVCYDAVPGSPGTPGATVPGTPGIPPVPPKPADYQAGWNASARSIASLSGNGQYKFQVSQDSVGVVTGLNDFNNGSAYQEIDFAFSMASGVYDIMEGGNKIGISGTFALSDVFIIVRINGAVLYYKNGVLLYTSTKSSVGTVFADSSLYFGGDEIFNASLTTAIDTTYSNTPASLNGVMDGMLGFFADSDGGYLQNTAMPSMLGDFREDVSRTGQLNGVLPSMHGQFVDTKASAQHGVLASMTGYFEAGLLVPDYNAIDLTLQTMTGFFLVSAGMTAALDAKLPSMLGYFGDADGGVMPPGAPPTTTDPVDPATGDWQTRSGSQLPMMVGMFVDDKAFATGIGSRMSGDLVLPAPMLVSGHIRVAGTMTGDIVLPALQGHGSMGWKSEIALPALQAHGEATIANVLRGFIVLPMLEARGTGVVGTVLGTPDGYPLPLPRLGVSGYVRGETSGLATLPALTAAGNIFTDAHLIALIRLPRLRASGLIITPNTIDPQNPLGRTLQGHVVLPALRAAHGAYASILLPPLRAMGSVPNGVTAPSRIGYAMNLKTNAVTEFTNYAFKAMGRAYNMYWGIGIDGGLYEIGGDLDDTKPIAWEWRSGLADFGVWGQKGVLAVYIRGIFENGAIIRFVTDDALRDYGHVAAGPYKTHKVHRVPLGRGVRTDSMAFGMANPKGGYLELDKVTPQYVIIPRNL